MQESNDEFNSLQCELTNKRGGVAQWVARLTRNVEVVGSSPNQRLPLFP